MPTVQAAFVAVRPQDGAIEALVGGFDFDTDKFNRVTQAWRQPGSSFKPFVYASSLERGLTPATQISDEPFFLTAEQTGSKPRSEEHTSELQSLMRNSYHFFCLEKQKKHKQVKRAGDHCIIHQTH